MHAFLAIFEPTDESTAICYVAAVVFFVLGAMSGLGGRWGRGLGGIGFVAIGLALWLAPLAWNTADRAF